MATKATILYWKMEDGPSEGACLTRRTWVRPGSTCRTEAKNPCAKGEWVTRADAQRLASENGYELQLDDGFD